MERTSIHYEMSDEEKAEYFDAFTLDIFNSKENILVDFIVECTDESGLIDSLKSWPKEIKVAVVNRFIKNHMNNAEGKANK